MTDYQFALLELSDRVEEICPVGGKISRSEIIAMILDRINFPRDKNTYDKGHKQ